MFETKPENQTAAAADPVAFKEKRKDDVKPAKCPTCGRDHVNS